MLRRHTFSFGAQASTVSVVSRDKLFDQIDPVRFFVADTNTDRLLPAGEPRFVLAAGEGSKSWTELESILTEMLSAELSRDSSVVGVGGGVTSDIASLAASLYMRGCNLVLVPTTLLAMVDAALGGKTSVNFGGYKNMVGTFYPATEVRLCPDVLHTLPLREYRSGLAEVIKTAMVGDSELFELLERETARIEQRDDDLLGDVVWRCVMVKGSTVETDLRETGIRAHLNLGHTFAHALESEKGLGSWSHGEAVAWGLARAMEIGVAAGVTSVEYARRVLSLLDAFGYRTEHLPDSSDAMLAAMQKDKKRRNGAGRFVVQKALGETIVTELDDALVRTVLEGGWSELHG
jgi:3-dehydroquinate synthase